MTRRALAIAAAALLSAFAAPLAHAEWPDHPIRFVVPFGPGGANDLIARVAADGVSKQLGQTVVIENRPGAGAVVGTVAVARAAPDGYTFLIGAAGVITNSLLLKNLPYTDAELVPVGMIAVAPSTIVVNPSVPAKTVPEFIAYVKANPDKVNVASSGNGTSIHLSGELFKMMTGIKMTHVPYKGSAPMLTDLLAGQVQVTFDNLPSSIGHIKAGKLRALAVTTAKRSPELPDVPTVAESVPGYEASAFFGFGVPHGTPKEIVDKLNHEINEALKDPGMLKKLGDLGGIPAPGTPDDFKTFLTAETAKWEKVVHAANLSIN